MPNNYGIYQKLDANGEINLLLAKPTSSNSRQQDCTGIGTPRNPSHVRKPIPAFVALRLLSAKGCGGL
jgi:hypothetical protein